MFDPEKEVPNLKLCKRLKELGYPQDGGGWYWWRTKGNKVSYLLKYFGEQIPTEIFYSVEYVKAPTIPEMVGWLGKIEFEGYQYIQVNSDTFAQDLIFYGEDRYITFKKRGEDE